MPRMILGVVVVSMALACSQPVVDRITLATEANPQFVMRDDLVGSVIKSSDPAKVGKQLTFVGIHSITPKVIYGTGESEPLQRVFEDERSMTLELVSSAMAGNDAFVIDKKTGTFAWASASHLGVSVEAAASVGRFK